MQTIISLFSLWHVSLLTVAPHEETKMIFFNFKKLLLNHEVFQFYAAKIFQKCKNLPQSFSWGRQISVLSMQALSFIH